MVREGLIYRYQHEKNGIVQHKNHLKYIDAKYTVH